MEAILKQESVNRIPYITPRKLLGDKKLPLECNIGFICYCPMPVIFEKYKLMMDLDRRLFIHTHNSHVMFCNYKDINFIVVAEVYGGPVSVTTVEELKHYGIETIIGIGFVGSFVERLPIGTMIVANKSLAEPGTTPHYNKDGCKYINSTLKLGLNIDKECVWTTNALYQEYDEDIKYAVENGCSVVNMDTSHLYAACNMLDIECEYYAIVSDLMVKHTDSQLWNNDLTVAINGDECNVTLNQKHMIYKILESFNIIRIISKFNFE